MKLAIVGTGYVGLVSGVCLAAKGHTVFCVDKNPKIVAALNAGQPHIFEIGLVDLLAEVRAAGRFVATSDLQTALDEVDLVIVAVGTPSSDGVIDLTYVKDVSKSIGAYIKTANRHISVVMKSTVVPGTTDTVVRKTIEEASGKSFPAFGLGMNPEFLREGEAIADFGFPDRIVLGFEDPKTLARLEELYAPWDVDKVRVNTRTAELIKYANNALLATQISAMNEIANLAAALGGVDVMDVLAGVQLDKRWNPILSDGNRANPAILSYLVPGCGFGGSCFPKDVQALRSQGEQLALPMHMLNAVLNVNDVQPEQTIDILQRAQPDLKGKRVLVLGLAFKPGTDDVRESASLKIVSRLASEASQVIAHDPIATENFRVALGAAATPVRFIAEWRDEVPNADVIVVATRWPEYQALSEFDLSGKILFDARRAFTPSQFAGAEYLAIGRRNVNPS
jgi:UDPglucose 6-dehydrogenase/GDP-mannose 6-dehydrogenase